MCFLLYYFIRCNIRVFWYKSQVNLPYIRKQIQKIDINIKITNIPIMVINNIDDVIHYIHKYNKKKPKTVIN